ncbi:MAG TPA: HEAT repeat domain-containing protein [Vicinamibacterales bacterium]|nr:HEAT repeat domain-containing protein [Vicinamibacterales bacterium]
MGLRRAAWGLVVFGLVVLVASCATATAPPASSFSSSVSVQPPVVTWEEKLGWILRLEDQRLLRDPNPPPPVVLVPATRTQPAIVAPPAPSDLIRLLGDPEARVRRRTALALGRVGLRDAVEPLTKLLSADPEPEVRQMAAFALGLVGDPSARTPLLAALADPDPLVGGRAAEALGMLGVRADATAVSDMVLRHVRAGALASITSDDLAYPLAPPVEAARLGLYALVRLGSYEALAAAALDASGRPVSTWWPLAYALQRLGDTRATPALVALLNTPGRYTPAFAARGLGVMKVTSAAAALRQIIERRAGDPAVVVQAIRAAAAIQDAAAAPVLTRIVADGQGDPLLRVEAMTALAAVAGHDSLDVMLDLLSDRSPTIRGLAMRSLARIDPEGFLVTLSGLDEDRDWTVRTSQAAALGSLPSGQGVPALMAQLGDRDPRVVPAVLSALVAAKAPGVDRILVERLKTDDFAVRAAAANGLAQIKARGAGPALVEAYREAAGDSTYVARSAILTAVNQVDPGAAEPLLQEALRDRDWAVRVRALAIYRERGSVDAAVDEAIRPAPARPLTDAERQWLISPKFSPHVFIETDRGVIELELAILDAPFTVANFVGLARRNFFDGIAIHRIVADFVVQDGDPRGDGEGGPGYTIRDEINMRPYLRGTVGMALDWEDTGGSQFFITHSPQPHLDGRYTVMGHVVNGMDVVDRLVPGDVIRRVRISDGVID